MRTNYIVNFGTRFFIFPIVILLASSFSYAHQWITSKDGYGTLDMASTNYNQIEWTTNSTPILSPPSGTIFNAQNGNTFGCTSMVGNWCPVNVQFAQYQYPGGSFRLTSSATTPLGNSASGKCYLTTLTGISGDPARSFVSSLHGDPSTGNTQYILNTNWIELGESCNVLTPSSVTVSNLNFIVPEFTGYILNLVSGSTLYPRQFSTVLNGQIWTSQSAFNTTASLRINTLLVSCPSPDVSLATCTRAASLTGSSASPVVPTASCDYIVPGEISFEDVSTSDFIGKKGSGTININCNLPATVNARMTDDGKVTVGPFSVQTKIDGSTSPSISIPSSGKSVDMSAEIIGNSGAVQAGSYENTLLLVLSVQ